MTVKPGTLVHLPAGTIHYFKFGGNVAKLISIPGKDSNLSLMFSDAAAENLNAPPTQEKLIYHLNLTNLLLKTALTH